MDDEHSRWTRESSGLTLRSEDLPTITERKQGQNVLLGDTTRIRSEATKEEGVKWIP